MKVEQLMTRDVETCTPDASLAHAAMILWRRDCGIVPVVEASGRFAGVITDRDICIAAGTRHASTHSVPVREVMTTRALTCGPSDDLRVAMHRMSEGQVRRMPVLDRQGRLVGILSINDLILAAQRSARREDDELSYGDVMMALKSISAHRVPGVLYVGI